MLTLCAGFTFLHRWLFRDFAAFNQPQPETQREIIAWKMVRTYFGRSPQQISQATGVALVPTSGDFYWPSAETWLCRDKDDGLELKLFFDASRQLCGAKDVTPPRTWPYAGLWEAVEWVRISASLAVQAVWLVLLVTCFWLWSRHRLLALWMITAALICALTWSPLMGPRVTIYAMNQLTELS